MDDIIREMAPGGTHHRAFHGGDSRSSEVVHKGAPYDRSLPSLYNGVWTVPGRPRPSWSSLPTTLLLAVLLLSALYGMLMAKKKKCQSRPRSVLWRLR